jgi:D-3-phosphoglycerate dehydrogenase
VLAYERHDPRDASLDWLRARGVDVRLGPLHGNPGMKRYSEDAIIAAAAGFDGVLGSSSARITRRVIEALPELRYISKLGIGVDTIDVEAATERGILVTNTPEEDGVVAVAEHAIAMMLALRKRLTHWTPAYLRGGGWRGAEHAGTVAGSTVGIVGFGRIGRAVAQRLSGWGVHLIAYDPFPGIPVAGVAFVDLPTLLARADVVTLHCGANASNQHMIDARALAAMKREAILVNTGRGSLVDTEALVAALRAGRLAGAALDVYEQEPPEPGSPLLALENVVLTPHVAAWTLDVFLERRRRAARNMLAMVSGADCPDLVNPESRARARPAAFRVVSPPTQAAAR